MIGAGIARQAEIVPITASNEVRKVEARVAHSLAGGGASLLVIDHAIRQHPSAPFS